jgi:acyl-CoA reductase-like NAD-dependent aldehyde dehydrogenase
MGKPLPEARAEIDKSAWVCEHYAEHGAEYLAAEQVDTEWRESYVHFLPIGVVLAIMPWNYPVWQVMRAAAPALMAGNTVVLKHAGNVTGTARLLAETLASSGTPSSLLEVIVIGAPRVAGVIADPRVAGVTLTGSEAAGVQVAGACALALKKSVLELGGSDPFVVMDDADVEAAAQAAVTGRFLNAGQSCIAAKRFIVTEAVAAEFEQAFAASAQRLVMGDPRTPGVELGPMARVDLRDELADQVSRALEAGGRLVCGGATPSEPGAYYPPTIVADLASTSPLAQEETFGPAAAILRVPDAASALAAANDSPYGLSASLWTSDIDRVAQLASCFQSGALFVNTTSASDPRMPFGGVKRSGWGRELGSLGIREFVNAQAVTIAPRS